MPTIETEEERIESILGDRPARFNVEDSEDADPGPVPWQIGELGMVPARQGRRVVERAQ